MTIAEIAQTHKETKTQQLFKRPCWKFWAYIDGSGIVRDSLSTKSINFLCKDLFADDYFWYPKTVTITEDGFDKIVEDYFKGSAAYIEQSITLKAFKKILFK